MKNPEMQLNKDLIPNTVCVITECFVNQAYWGLKDIHNNFDLNTSKLHDRIMDIIAKKFPQKLNDINPKLKDFSRDLFNFYESLQINVKFEDIFHYSYDYPQCFFEVKHSFKKTVKFDCYIRMILEISCVPKKEEIFYEYISPESMASFIDNLFNFILNLFDEIPFWYRSQYPYYIFCLFEYRKSTLPEELVKNNFNKFYRWLNMRDMDRFLFAIKTDPDSLLKQEYPKLDNFATNETELLYFGKNSGMWFIPENFTLITQFLYEGLALSNRFILDKSTGIDKLTLIRYFLDIRAIAIALNLLNQSLNELFRSANSFSSGSFISKKKITLNSLKQSLYQNRDLKQSIENYKRLLINEWNNNRERDKIIEKSMEIFKISTDFQNIFQKFDNIERIIADLVYKEESESKHKSEKMLEHIFAAIGVILAIPIIIDSIAYLNLIPNISIEQIKGIISLTAFGILILIIVISSIRSHRRKKKN